MTTLYIDHGNADGFCMGKTTTDKVGFHGSTPSTQRSGSAQDAVVDTAATSTTPFGYTEAQANAILALLNELRATHSPNCPMTGTS